MLGIGGTELALILFIGFLLFGPEKLPQMGRTVGRAIRQFKNASNDMNKKFREEVYDPFKESVEPMKQKLQEESAPMKEDFDAIRASFTEAGDALKTPLTEIDGAFQKQAAELKDPLGIKEDFEDAKAAFSDPLGLKGSFDDDEEDEEQDTPEKEVKTVPLPKEGTGVAASLYGLTGKKDSTAKDDKAADESSDAKDGE